MTLETLLTLREPLGPIDQSNVHSEADADELLDDRVAPVSEALSRMPILLLGRKGSGKSSILAEFRLHAAGRRRNPSNDSPPQPGEPIQVMIDSWDHFHQLTRHVATQYRETNSEWDSELVPTEYLANLWQEAIWDAIIQHFYSFCHHRESRAQLTAVERYVLADGHYSGSARTAAKALLTEARRAVLSYAKSRGSTVFLFIDSMEKYPVRNAIFAEVLGGLLQAINKVHYESPSMQVTFCLPEEIESHLQSGSSNIMKDYNAAYRIRWKPMDLLKVAAHRFRLFARTRDQTLYNSIRSFDLNQREGIHSLYREILPEGFLNGLGEPEDPLAYIVRHTHLLPRHVIAIFNAIVARSYENTRQFRTLDEFAIRNGVLDAEKVIAQQVLVPFYRIYPGLIAACEDILPDLAPVCSFNELRKIERRFSQRVEDDVANIWRTLFAMGVLGRVAQPDPGPDRETREARYCFAHFQFNIEGSFGLSTGGEYCFHPVFSRHFGLTRSLDDHRVIYPANVEILTLS